MSAFRVHRSTDLILLGLFAAAALICAAAIAPIVWTAVQEMAAYQERLQAEEDPRACLGIENEGERLRCLERQLSHQTRPARGAYPPRSAFWSDRGRP
jgi:hypothetical protein